jgi:bacterioferritin-associated ferredoxin
MIVCICRGVSDRTVKRAIEDGAESVAAVGRACGAGTDCGSCHLQIAGQIAESLPEMTIDRCCAPEPQESLAPALWSLPILQGG